jgi:hypothetical protein
LQFEGDFPLRCEHTVCDWWFGTGLEHSRREFTTVVFSMGIVLGILPELRSRLRIRDRNRPTEDNDDSG